MKTSGTSNLPTGDVLPSWNHGTVKQSIVDFVTRAVSEDDKHFIPLADRIAVFDDDGTFWTEQPIYTQLAFALDRVKALAPRHPEWDTEEPFASLLKGDLKGALAGGERALARIVVATHAGMTTEEFGTGVHEWIAAAKHPTTAHEMRLEPCLRLPTQR